METQYEELLKKFQCDYNRILEENFAQTLSENEKVRLFFINENQAFTDGRNIVVDPAEDELFADRSALDQTGDYLKWPKVVLADPWNALRIVTRAQTIHESLHLLYTDFPGRHMSDPKCSTKNKKTVMGMISNIIEDSYIEAAGCSVYDNMEFYLKFGRVSRLFSHMPSEGTIDRTFGKMVEEEKKEKEEEGKKEPQKEKRPEKTNSEILVDYLNYMGTFLLYPMVIQKEPAKEIRDFVEASKVLFLEGSAAPSPKERYDCSSKIFDLIAHLIPDDSEKEPDLSELKNLLGGTKTHEGGVSISEEQHEGKAQVVNVRLFTDKEGKERPDLPSPDELMKTLQEFAKDKNVVINIIDDEGSFSVIPGSSYDASPIHKNIKINENFPKINPNLRKAYQNIYDRYKINIRSYNSRFSQILKTQDEEREEKYQYGSGITSTRMGDIKKRYWYRKAPAEGLPDMAVMLLIDGSGSMQGARQKAAMHSAVILHEVLKKQGILHCVAEHRGGEYDEPEIDVNILLSLNPRRDEELNLMRLDACSDNRDGLALFWAERYLQRNTTNDYRLIIVLSDGYPAHDYDDYYPPVSTKDTANAVKKITKRGTNIIGVSLDEPGSYSTYDALSEIYPNLIACNDLSRLTGQILGIITRLL